MIYRALIPVKALDEAKSRLAGHMTLHQRKNLVLDMLHHVLHVLQQSNLLEQITVVSPDIRVLDFAQTWGVRALVEEMPGHNAALHAAALQEQEAGTTALLTISGDLPLLQPSDIRALIERSLRYPVVLAPSRDGSTIYNSIGLALDIDTIDDLDDLYELQVLSGEKIRSWPATHRENSYSDSEESLAHHSAPL
ncbi:MAG: 2-phospho-L-lactate guanylyltransferase [Chloroflexi bacterium]|nr:MAG: 2-phospho-L-lactate guanylyltransferase [Chloroflexota bacterium]